MEIISFSSINRLLKGPYFFKRLRALIKQDFNPSETRRLGGSRFRRYTSAVMFGTRGMHHQQTGWPMTLTLFRRFFLGLHLEDFQCHIRHLLSSQINRFLHLKQTEPPSAYHHHWLYHCQLHFAIQLYKFATAYSVI